MVPVAKMEGAACPQPLTSTSEKITDEEGLLSAAVLSVCPNARVSGKGIEVNLRFGQGRRSGWMGLVPVKTNGAVADAPGLSPKDISGMVLSEATPSPFSISRGSGDGEEAPDCVSLAPPVKTKGDIRAAGVASPEPVLSAFSITSSSGVKTTRAPGCVSPAPPPKTKGSSPDSPGLAPKDTSTAGVTLPEPGLSAL